MEISPHPDKPDKALVTFDDWEEQFLFTSSTFPFLSVTGLRLYWEMSGVEVDAYPASTTLRNRQLGYAARRLDFFSRYERNPMLDDWHHEVQSYINEHVQ